MTDDCPPPILESLRQYARDLRRNSSGGDDYPWDFARAIADRLDEIAGSLSSTERPTPDWHDIAETLCAVDGNGFLDDCSETYKKAYEIRAKAVAALYATTPLSQTERRHLTKSEYRENLWVEDGAPVSSPQRTIAMPEKLSPTVIAACVGGGITSDQITHIYSLIRAAVSLYGEPVPQTYRQPVINGPNWRDAHASQTSAGRSYSDTRPQRTGDA